MSSDNWTMSAWIKKKPEPSFKEELEKALEQNSKNYMYAAFADPKPEDSGNYTISGAGLFPGTITLGNGNKKPEVRDPNAWYTMTIPFDTTDGTSTREPDPLVEFDKEMREEYPTLEKAYQNYLNIRRLLK